MEDSGMKVEPSWMELMPYKRGPRELPCPFHQVEDRMRSLRPRRGPPLDHAGILISDFQAPELWKINFSCSQASQFVVFCYGKQIKTCVLFYTLLLLHTHYIITHIHFKDIPNSISLLKQSIFINKHEKFLNAKLEMSKFVFYNCAKKCFVQLHTKKILEHMYTTRKPPLQQVNFLFIWLARYGLHYI